MKHRPTSRRRRTTKSVLRLLDLEHAKTAVLNCFRLAKAGGRASGGSFVLRCSQLRSGRKAARTVKLMEINLLGEISGEPGRTRTSNPLIVSQGDKYEGFQAVSPPCNSQKRALLSAVVTSDVTESIEFRKTKGPKFVHSGPFSF